MALKFSGHESFHCRSLWLKKGYDHLKSGFDFKDEALIHLGVGRNMVSSVRYWVKSFGLVDTENEVLRPISHHLFSDKGWDPYLEDIGTLWLLHTWIIKQGYASIYGLIFNELRKRKPRFSIQNFIDLVREFDLKTSESSLKKDFQAFTRTYVQKANDKDLEDSYSGVLTELDIIKEVDKGLEIEPRQRTNIPLAIFLYCILERHKDSNSISFESLYNDPNSVGSIFALSREGLHDLLEAISEEFRQVTYSNKAGIREIQLKESLDPLKILQDYYGN